MRLALIGILTLAALQPLGLAAPLPPALEREFAKKPTGLCEGLCTAEKGCPCVEAGLTCGCGKREACDCELNQYGHLPTSKECQEAYESAVRWREAVLKQAKDIGYMAETSSPEIWDGIRLVWAGGGWHAEQMKQEIEESAYLQQVWWVAWWLKTPGLSAEALREWEAELRSLIGDHAYVTSRLPPPIPVWRVPRRW